MVAVVGKQAVLVSAFKLDQIFDKERFDYLLPDSRPTALFVVMPLALFQKRFLEL